MFKVLVLSLLECLADAPDFTKRFIPMFTNYIKVTLRHLWRNKTYTLINVLGLSIGMTCAILLYLYVQDERSYDSYHRDKSQIYRVESDMKFGDKTYKLNIVPSPLAPTLQEKYTDIIQSARILDIDQAIVRLGKQRFYQNGVHYVDPSIFQVLTFKPIAGNTDRVLIKPNTTVINRTLATKLFRSPQQALGQVVFLNDSIPYTVEAVMENVPNNSHFKPEMLVSMSTHRKEAQQEFNSWDNFGFTCFVKLKRGASPQKIETYLKSIYHQHIEPKMSKGNSLKMHLRPLEDIHLYSKLEGDYADTGDAQVVYIFGVIAVLILLIASANYMNLATAKSIERAKEVGIRKVVGAYRTQLIYQFLVEAIILGLVAFVVSLSLVELLLPYFNHLTDKALGIKYIEAPQVLLFLLGVALFTGLFSGGYPALILSHFQPSKVLKGKFSHSKRGQMLRKGLVVFQFSISIIMIIGTGVVYNQMQFISKRNLGYDKDLMYNFAFVDSESSKKFSVLREQLLRNPDIKAVTGSMYGMDDGYNLSNMLIEQPDGSSKNASVAYFFVADSYFKELKMKIKQGRAFDASNRGDYANAIIVNEAFVRKQGWKNPIGKQIGYELNAKGQAVKRGQIVGVVADFHMESLYRPIEPLMMRFAPGNKGNIRSVFVKLRPGSTKKSLAYIQQTWEKLQPQTPFQGQFLDQRAASAYESDRQRGQVFLSFALIAIFIACLGLFGLASFTARQRTKEIGIRKVLGASVNHILRLLSIGFVRLVLISSLIAFPLSYYLMNQWLQNFAYRTTMPWGIFVAAGVVTLLIALLTVSVQSLRTARLNPVQVLKDE